AAGFQADIAGGTVATAVTAARREFDALEGAVEIERLVDAVFHFDGLAEAAAHAAGAAGVLAVFLAPDDHGRHRFEDLDRAAAHTAWKSGRRQAVTERQRAHAASGGDLDLKALVDFRRTGLGTQDGDAPQRAGVLGRHPIRDRLTQAAENEIGQHQADLAARDHPRRLDGVENAALRRGYGARFQRAGIVGNVAGDDA